MEGVQPRDVGLLEDFQRAQALFTDRVDAVGPEGWDAEVAPGRTVADLVAAETRRHLLVPLLLSGEPAGAGDDVLPTGTEDLLDGDPLGSWEAAADGALTAWARPGAMSGSVHLRAGPVPATDLLVAGTVALTVHSWDVARATGGDTRLDPGLVDAALLSVSGAVATEAPPDGFPAPTGPPLPVAEGADPQTRLLARLGRRG